MRACGGGGRAAGQPNVPCTMGSAASVYTAFWEVLVANTRSARNTRQHHRPTTQGGERGRAVPPQGPPARVQGGVQCCDTHQRRSCSSRRPVSAPNHVHDTGAHPLPPQDEDTTHGLGWTGLGIPSSFAAPPPPIPPRTIGVTMCARVRACARAGVCVCVGGGRVAAGLVGVGKGARTATAAHLQRHGRGLALRDEHGAPTALRHLDLVQRAKAAAYLRGGRQGVQCVGAEDDVREHTRQPTVSAAAATVNLGAPRRRGVTPTTPTIETSSCLEDVQGVHAVTVKGRAGPAHTKALQQAGRMRHCAPAVTYPDARGPRAHIRLRQTVQRKVGSKTTKNAE